MRIVVIGGGAAGATAAQFARKNNRDADIILFEETSYPQYSRCGLPYALSGEIPSHDALIEHSVESFHRNKIDLRLSTRVDSVDASRRKVIVSGSSENEEIAFDNLVFATGAKPSLPRIDGLLSGDGLRSGVFFLRGMDDLLSLMSWLETAPRKVLIVGAGLIGLECAGALRAIGHGITIVEYLDSVLPTMIDPDMTDALVGAITESGIELRLSSAVEAISDEGEIMVARIRSRSGDTTEIHECDTVILATGQNPCSETAERAGCKLGAHSHIIVDEHCETNIKGVYAAGDCSQYRDFVTGEELPVGMGTLAVRMGEIAGRNASGGHAHLPSGFLSSRVTRLFGTEIAAVGPLSTQLSKAGIGFIQSRVKGSTLPEYFPGGKELTVKLIAADLGSRILSCQIVGEEGAGLRADIAGATILSGMDVGALAALETAYAPPVAPCVDVLSKAAQSILIKLERRQQS